MKLHEKLGHLAKSKMRILLVQQVIDGLHPKDLDLWVECAVCDEANSKQRRTASQEIQRADNFL